MERGEAVEVQPNVVDPAIFRPGPADPALRDRLGIAPDEVVLGFCGELRHKKGLPFLLGALREVRRSRPACLLVIGEVRAREASALSTFAAEAPEDAAHIVVTGHLDAPATVAEHLRACDVVLMPSVWDGLPNALLEAMACGRPVIASDAGGIPEVIEPGVNGLLLPKIALHRLGVAILELLDQGPSVRASLGAAARQRIETHFHPDRERRLLRHLAERLFS